MQTSQERTDPDDAPVTTEHRMTGWEVAAGAAAVALGLLIAGLVRSKMHGVKLTGSALTDGAVPVRGHLKNQAFGSDYSQHRQIEIGPYLRGPRAA